MQKFIHQKNLEHYRKLLAETTDEAKRRVIRELLEAEESKDEMHADSMAATGAAVNAAAPDKKEQGGGG